jgi:hypothetical protein
MPSRSVVPQHDGVADRLRRGDEQDGPGLGGEPVEPSQEALLEATRQSGGAYQTEAAGELRRRHPPRQLEQCQRVAMALGHDPVADRGIERGLQVVHQERAGIAVAEPSDGQQGELGEEVVTDARARRTHERDPLGEEPAGDEPDDLGRGMVEPLHVVDDADERALLRDLGE